MGYLHAVRPALKRKWLVVGDRWMFGYVVQPRALKFHGPDLLARVIIRFLPRPDLTVNLAAPPHVIRARKQELSVTEIEQELLAWCSLPLSNVRTLDATQPPEAIAEQILIALASTPAPSSRFERRVNRSPHDDE
jgi:thymidylate kinase